MTVNSENQKDRGLGNGATTIFPYDFKINAQADLLVQVADAADQATTLVLDSDYTVSGAGESGGGNVTTLDLTAITGAVKLPTGWSITITRQLGLVQETDLSAQDGFSDQTHEDVFDYITMITQQLQEEINRAVKVSITSGLDGDDFTEELDDAVEAALAAAVAAEASAVAAAASAVDAETAETNAETAETNAETAETNAAASAAAAAASAAITTDIVEVEYGESITEGDLLKFINDSGAKVKKIIGNPKGVYGASATFLSGSALHISCCYDSANDKVVVAYKDNSNAAGRGEAIVGSISGDTVSFDGAIVGFTGAEVDDVACCYDSVNEKIVICYRNADSSDKGYAIIGTVSGDSISFGTAVEFESGATSDIACCFDTTNEKVVIAFTDTDDTNKGKSIIGAVSGTSISFGTAVEFNASATTYNACVFDVANSKVLIAFVSGATVGKAITGTVSSDSISFGTVQTFESGTTAYISCCYSVARENVMIAFVDVSDSSQGKAIIGYYNGTVHTFGISVKFSAHVTSYTACSYDDNNDRYMIFFHDTDVSGKGYFISGVISGDTSLSQYKTIIVFDDLTNSFSDTSATYIASLFVTANRTAFICYNNGSNGVAASLEYDTPEKFFAVAQETGADTEVKNVIIIGGTSVIHSGKTPGRAAYIQPDGTIGYLITEYPIGRFISTTALRLTKTP